MGYDKAVMRAALGQYRADKDARESRRREKIQALYSRVPRLEEISRELRSTAAHAVAAAFRTGNDPAPLVEALSRESLALQRERAELLVEAGLPYEIGRAHV